MSISKRIILSYITIRGSDIESIYKVLKFRGPTSIDELKDLFAIVATGESSEQSGQLNDCISFLVNVEILKTDNSGTEVDLASDFAEMPFKLVLLNKFRLDKNNPFSLIHSLLVDYDLIRVSLNGLKPAVEKALDLEFTWTDEKLDFWLDLANYIGLVRKFAGHRSFAFYPNPELVHDIILNYPGEKGTELNLRRILGYCSTNFFNCLTKEGRIFKGLQQSLLFLKSKNLITLIPAASDDPNPVRVDGKPYSLISLERKD